MVALAASSMIPAGGLLAGQLIAAGHAAADPTDPVQMAACDFGRQLTTYTFTDYDAYNRRVLDDSTGAFHDQFQSTSADRRTHILDTHTSSDVLSVECSTQTADADHAQMVVSVDQTTRSDASFGLPRPERTVMHVSLDNVGGRWLAERVDPVPPN
jgi:Mce-associated membrane protein